MKGRPRVVDVVDRADVGVLERGRRPSLPLEPLQGLRVRGDVLGKKLQGDPAAEPEVLGQIHDAHSAGAQLLQDSIVGDRFVEHGRFGRMLAAGTRKGRGRPGLRILCRPTFREKK